MCWFNFLPICAPSVSLEGAFQLAATPSYYFCHKGGKRSSAYFMDKVKIADIQITQRIRKEITSIKELAANIQRIGLINPITVMKDVSGEIRLLAGLRRLKAVQSIGWTEIDVNMVAPADAEEILLIEINENEQRESFTFSEKMDYARLLEEIEQTKAKERMVDGGLSAGRGRPKEDEKGKDARPYPFGNQSRDAIGEKLGMSGRTYERAKHIRDNASQEVIDRLDSGESSIYKEYNALRANEKLEDKPIVVVESEIVAMDKVPPNIDSDSPSCDVTELDDESKYLKPIPRILKPLSQKDEEAQQKINEFNALPPMEKIEVLQEQLRSERARAAEAESELKRERELHHNTKYHSQLSITNLEGQVAELTTKVSELAKALGLQTE